jgi:hypothetical protein
MTHDGTQEIDKDDEAHGETTAAAQFFEANELEQVMYRGINPLASLRKQDAPSIRNNDMDDNVRCKFHLEEWEMLHHNRRQIAILSELGRILLMEHVNITLGILLDDVAGDDKRTTLIGCPDSMHREIIG